MKRRVSNRPTRAVIDLDALAGNFNACREFIGPEVKYMAVVKADAYGHGAVRCAKRLEAEGVDWFGVAIPAEGVELRTSGIRKRILCLGSFWSGQETLLLNHHLTPVIYRLDQAESFNSAAAERGAVAEVHVKIDTGMGRIGVRPDELDQFLDKFAKFGNLHVEGVLSHFAAADDPASDEFSKRQFKLFTYALKAFEARGHRPVYRAMANSPGSFAHPESHGNLVRLGGALYGLTEDVLSKEADRPELRPVMRLQTEIVHLKNVSAGETLGYGRTFETARDSLIATLPIGYQDGYPRLLSNKARVIVRGEYAPVVGRVSMDWTLVDVTDIEGAEVGDKVVLMGSEGGCSVRAEELAGLSQTISYEITCGIHRRVTRKYVEGGKKQLV